MIDVLAQHGGIARDILNVSHGSTFVDLSDEDWETKRGIIRGVVFDRFYICGVVINWNLVECMFHSCKFQQIKSTGHFMGAADTWDECDFVNCSMGELIAPQKTFSNCTFRGTEFCGLRLCQSVFIDCVFEDCVVDGISADHTVNPTIRLDATYERNASALFQRCTFQNTVIKNSVFDRVWFEQCKVTRSRFDACSFSDVLGPDRWWVAFDECDQMSIMLAELLKRVRHHIGQHSRAYYEISSYLDRYKRGEATAAEYADILYSGKVPEFELDLIQDDLDDVERVYMP